jgi:hypothetical protein
MRTVLFDKEPVPGLSGLAGLTAPQGGVSLVIDIVVLGAKGDGKTQLITHAIRTLDARAAIGLSTDELLQNEKILHLVLNAKRPLPEANPDRKVRHYVFRVRPEVIAAGLGPLARLALLTRAGLIGRYLLGALLSAALVFGALVALRGGIDVAAVVGAALSAAAGVALAGSAARRALAERGDVEVVFWDVAGEDVYSDRGAGSYHSFLSTLAERRRADRRDGSYALGPVLICNPQGLGKSPTDSPYARLRMILPTFATLHGRPDVLVVVNRSRLAAAVCDRRAVADELVAVLPVARDASIPGAGATGAALDPLPVVRRDVVLAHCYDAEPEASGQTRFTTIRYDAGLDAETHEDPWPGYDQLPADARARWGEPAAAAQIARLIEYRYAEGPGTLAGDAAAGFFGWLARVGWPWRRPAAGAGLAPLREEPGAPTEASTAKMYAPALVADAPASPPVVEEKRGGFRSGT